MRSLNLEPTAKSDGLLGLLLQALQLSFWKDSRHTIKTAQGVQNLLNYHFLVKYTFLILNF